MVINWTKIIILILIIAAFTGIVVGIVLAFRAQCPDGKIFDKKCNKCVTKCPDGRELPTNKNGDRDCDSDVCQKICPEYSCRIDSETCGEPCVNKNECCEPGTSCYIGNDTCMENNCGDQFCDLSISGTQCINGTCSNGDVKCDKKDSIKCGNGLCCPSGSVCTESNNTTFCCKPGDVLSNTGCCPKDKVNKTNNDCCYGDQSEWAGICCPKLDQCYDVKGNKICCPSDTGFKCVSLGDKKICKLPCGDKFCSTGQFCDKNVKPPTCANDPCGWGDTTYDPPDINGQIICKSNFDQTGTLCSDIRMPPSILGVWKPDWKYNPGEPGGMESDGLDCRTVSVKSNNPSACSSKYQQNKLAQLNLSETDWNVKNGTGILTGQLNCMNKWKTGPAPTIPDVASCLDGGVCCKPKNSQKAGGSCGTWCLNSDEYCLIDPDTSGENIPCNGHLKSGIKPSGTGGIADKNKNFCLDNCAAGWAGPYCGTKSCDNIDCSKITCTVTDSNNLKPPYKMTGCEKGGDCCTTKIDLLSTDCTKTSGNPTGTCCYCCNKNDSRDVCNK